MSRPSKLPAWGGGSGARMAPDAAASKLRTVKDRSASSLGFRCGSEQDDKAASSTSGWGFCSAIPEPMGLEEEAPPAGTPPIGTPVSLTPVKATPTKAADARPPVQLADSDARSGADATAPASLPHGARVALELLAAQLGAAAKAGAPQPVEGSWDETFLAGVAVGLQLPAGSRRLTAVQRALVAVLIIGSLAVVGGSALLLGGLVEAHPQVVYYA